MKPHNTRKKTLAGLIPTGLGSTLFARRYWGYSFGFYSSGY